MKEERKGGEERGRQGMAGQDRVLHLLPSEG